MVTHHAYSSFNAHRPPLSFSPLASLFLTHVLEIVRLSCKVDVLGVLRCDWAELASLVGVAVTPVVGFLGNLSREQIHPNPDEVR